MVFDFTSWSRFEASARRSAPGGATPGLLRAAARTKACARATALTAMPYQTALQSRCEVASIDWAAISAKGFGRICSFGASPLKSQPSEQVPRMPSVSQTWVCSSVYWSLVKAVRT